MKRLLCLLPILACAEPRLEWTPEDPVPEHATLWLERIYAVEYPPGVVVGGFDGAALGAEEVVLSAAGRVLGQATPDANGRFRIEVPEVLATVELGRAGGGTVSFRVRDPAVARVAALAPSLGGAGLTPNDLVIVGPTEHPFGALVRSGDNAITALDLERGLLPNSGVFLEQANPWFVAPLQPGGTEVVVSAFALDQVQVVDLGALERPPLVLLPGGPIQLDAPWPLLEPRDLDGDGTPETTVSAFTPSTPQPVVAQGGRVYAGFTSVISARIGSRGPVQLPGTLLGWALSDPSHPHAKVLPFHNPQELRALADGRILIVASGILDPIGDRVEVRTPGGVLVYDPDLDDFTEVYELGDFGGGTAVWTEEAIWVGSLARPVLRRIDRAPPHAVEDLLVNEESVDSIFRMIELDGGLVAVPSFNTDRLHVLDLRTRSLDPLPFLEPFAVGPGRPVFQGLQVVARRPGRLGVDFVGPDLFMLFGPSSSVTPLELRKVLGP